jgi:hypothetical protein
LKNDGHYGVLGLILLDRTSVGGMAAR